MPDTTSILTAGAHAIVADLMRSGAPPCPLVSEALVAGGWRVRILVGPAGELSALDLTPCEQDILCVLSEANGRWCTNRVLAELDRRGLIHGECTVKKALSRLHKAGRIGNSRKAPRGYWLAAE